MTALCCLGSAAMLLLGGIWESLRLSHGWGVERAVDSRRR